MQKILNDGKKRDWSGKKVKSLKVSESQKRQEDFFGSRFVRMHECGTVLRFNECEQEHKKLTHANFCRDRLCPMCNGRRSLKLFAQISQVLHEASKRRKIRYLFLTLTGGQRVDAEALPQRLDEMFEACRRLFQYKQVDKNMIGWIRNLEITYCKETKTYHPHFHVVLGVAPGYFSPAENYLNHQDWVSFWQRAMKSSAPLVVNIKAVKPNRRGGTIEGAVAETAKYSVKDTDYILDDIAHMDDVVLALGASLRYRRLIGFGKLFKQLHKELNLSDIESDTADLVNVDDKDEYKLCICEICQSVMREVEYRFDMRIMNYIEMGL